MQMALHKNQYQRSGIFKSDKQSNYFETESMKVDVYCAVRVLSNMGNANRNAKQNRSV